MKPAGFRRICFIIGGAVLIVVPAYAHGHCDPGGQLAGRLRFDSIGLGVRAKAAVKCTRLC